MDKFNCKAKYHEPEDIHYEWCIIHPEGCKNFTFIIHDEWEQMVTRVTLSFVPEFTTKNQSRQKVTQPKINRLG